MNLCISKKKGELDSLQLTKKTTWITFFATFAIKLMRISETMCWITKYCITYQSNRQEF